MIREPIHTISVSIRTCSIRHLTCGSENGEGMLSNRLARSWAQNSITKNTLVSLRPTTTSCSFTMFGCCEVDRSNDTSRKPLSHCFRSLTTFFQTIQAPDSLYLVSRDEFSVLSSRPTFFSIQTFAKYI